MLRTKTDRVDAALIARFCAAHQPAPWTPPPPERCHLQALARRLASGKPKLAVVGVVMRKLLHYAHGVQKQPTL